MSNIYKLAQVAAKGGRGTSNMVRLDKAWGGGDQAGQAIEEGKAAQSW